MRVLNLSQSYAPAWSFGGPVRSMHELNTALVAQECEVRVLTTSIRGSEDPPMPSENRWHVRDGVQVRYAGRSTLGRLRLAQKLAACLRWADVVHLNGFFVPFLPLVLAELSVLGSQKRLVVSPRGSLSPWSLRQRHRKKSLALRCLTPALNRVDLYHCTSRFEADGLERLGLGPIAVIPNGVNAPRTLPAKNTVPNRLLMLGRLHPVKGCQLALKALRRMVERNIEPELIFAGPDENGYRGELERYARRLGVRGRVTFQGQVTGEEKVSLLRSSALLWLPSRHENFGNVVPEALVHELPVIASDQTPWGSLNRQQCGRHIGLSAEAFAAASEELLKSPEALHAMGKRGRTWALKEFNWMNIALRFENAYVSDTGVSRPTA
ncbi:MAG: glycosyltransferase [Myxococcota bacterium]